MQLFVSPGACCLGTHVVVHELDLAVDAVTVPLPRFVIVSDDSPPVTLAATVKVDAPRLMRSALPERVSVSAAAPACFGEAATAAPSAASGLARSAVRFHTVS